MEKDNPNLSQRRFLKVYVILVNDQTCPVNSELNFFCVRFDHKHIEIDEVKIYLLKFQKEYTERNIGEKMLKIEAEITILGGKAKTKYTWSKCKKYGKKYAK